MIRHITAMFLAAMLFAAPAHAQSGNNAATCNVEVSASMTFAAVKSTFDVASQAKRMLDGEDVGLGLGFGCDWLIANPVFVGALIRYTYDNIKVSREVDDTIVRLSQTGQWMVAARAGMHVTHSLAVYGLVGVTGTSIDAYVSSVNREKQLLGTALGAGIDWSLTPAWAMRAEYTFNFAPTEKLTFAEVSQGWRLESQSHAFRVGVLYRFH